MRIRSVEVREIDGDRSAWVRVGHDTAVPMRFEAAFVLDEPPCEVSLRVVTHRGDAVPAIEAIAVGRITWPLVGPAVTARVLRELAVEELRRLATVKVSQPIVNLDNGEFQLVRDVEAGRSVGYGGRGLRGAGRGRDARDDVLARVAEIYRAALGAGLPPTKAVSEQLPCSYSHAGRLVGQARRGGYLQPTIPGRAGA